VGLYAYDLPRGRSPARDLRITGPLKLNRSVEVGSVYVELDRTRFTMACKSKCDTIDVLINDRKL
jgi:hypothetical protein